MRLGFVVLTGVGIALSACTGDPPRSTAVERDSAGITIVESSAPRWTPGKGWLVDSTPLLDLTTSGTGPAHEFFRVRDAMQLADGSIVVADNGSHQVRFFSSTGEFLSAVGREGEGPGEFSRLTSVDRFRGDSIIAFDFWLGRITVIDPQREVSRIISQYNLDVRLDELHVLLGVGFAAKGRSRNFEFGDVKGLYRMPEQVVTTSFDGELVDTVANIQGSEDYWFALGDVAPLFQKDGHLAVFGNRIYLGSADQMQFEICSATGRLLRIIRVPDYDLHLTADMITRERDYLLGQPNVRPVLRDVYMTMPEPETRPAYSNLLVDTEGNVWAAGFHSWVESQDPTDWEVFSPVGEWLGTVRVPPRFTVYEIGVDYVLGKGLDQSDVEHVQLLRMYR